MRTYLPTVLIASLLAGAMIAGLVSGCNDTSDRARVDIEPLAEVSEPPETSEEAPSETVAREGYSGKVKMVAYINVTSGCQVETVALINNLAMDHADLLELEFVDFGSDEGRERWLSDGFDCMTLVFNDSPVLRYPDAGGQMVAMHFAMPAGIGWTHEDLELAFQALKDGTLEILTEEEAEGEFAPQPVDVAIEVREVAGAGQLMMNDTPALTVKAKSNGMGALVRGEAAMAALESWLKKPVHPSQLTINADEEAGTASIMAWDIEVIEVTAEDAKKAGLSTAQALASEWLGSMRAVIGEAVNKVKAEGKAG